MLFDLWLDAIFALPKHGGGAAEPALGPARDDPGHAATVKMTGDPSLKIDQTNWPRFPCVAVVYEGVPAEGRNDCHRSKLELPSRTCRKTESAAG